MNQDKNTILRLSLFNSLMKMLLIVPYFLFALHFENIGLKGEEIGFIFALGTLTSIFTTLPSGFSNDSMKSKHLIAIAGILLALQNIGLAFTTNFALISVLFLLGGTGSKLYTTSIDSLFHKNTKREEIGQKLGTFHTLNYLFFGIGFIVAGWLLENTLTFADFFLITGGLYVIMTIVSQIILPGNDVAKFKILEYKKEIANTKVLLFILAVFIFAIHFGAENTSYALFLKHDLGLSRFQVGLYMGVAILSMSLTAWIISRYLHKIRPRYLLLFGLFVSGTGHILMTIKDPMLSAIFRIYHEIGDAAMFFFMYYGINRLFSSERIGGNSGIFTFVTTISTALGAAIFGPIGEQFGYSYPLLISGVTTIISLIITLIFLKHFDH